MSNLSPLRSRSESLSLFERNKGLAVATLSRKYPGLSPFEREECLTGAMLGLWTACQRFDPLKGFAFSTFATVYIVFGIKQTINGRKKARELSCVSLSDPLALGEGTATVADTVAAPVLGSCPVEAVLRQEAIGEAMDAWGRLRPSIRKQKPTLAGDIASTFGRSAEVARSTARIAESNRRRLHNEDRW